MAIISALPNNLTNGTTADASQVMADFNQIVNNVNSNAAENGANSSITSLSGLLTPLSVGQGGTGSGTAAGARSNLSAAASGANTDITSVLASVSSMSLIASATANNSATIDFTSISNATYDSYRIVITDLIPATNNTNLLLRTSAGGVFRSTADYSWQNLRWTTAASAPTGQAGVATGIALDAAGADNMANTVGGSWVIDFFNCSNTTLPKRCVYQGRYSGSTEISISGSGTSAPATAVDGFRFLMDSGNITSGTFKLYGIRA